MPMTDTTRDHHEANAPRSGEKVMAGVLLAAAILVAAWEVMAWRSRRPQDPMGMEERFAGFSPGLSGWYAEELESPSDPLQLNIVSYSLRKSYPSSAEERAPVLVRLVHGYNMRDCMRIKGYEVALLLDGRADAEDNRLRRGGLPTQVWQLTDPVGETSIWVTTMLEGTAFGATDTDVRAMPFPRVGTPDAVGWAPQGVSWESLRHPIRGLRRFLWSRWNAARCDWLTFLRLRKPAWASGELLTLVSFGSLPRDAGPESRARATAHVSAAHAGFHRHLLSWAAASGDEQPQE